jgi:hypothetical protein
MTFDDALSSLHPLLGRDVHVVIHGPGDYLIALIDGSLRHADNLDDDDVFFNVGSGAMGSDESGFWLKRELVRAASWQDPYLILDLSGGVRIEVVPVD